MAQLQLLGSLSLALLTATVPTEARSPPQGRSSSSKQQTCAWSPGMDSSCTDCGSTLNTTTKEDCCAACWADPNCKVGVFQNNSVLGVGNRCYLKGGYVQPQPKPSGDIVACVARHNPAPAPPVPCFNAPDHHCEIAFVTANLSAHTFSGFGADIVWPSNARGFAGFAPLGLKYLRVAEGSLT